MNINQFFQTTSWRFALVLGCVLVLLGSVYFNITIGQQLETAERQRMRTWAQAQESILKAANNCDLSFQSQIISENEDIPMILVDGDYRIIDVRNYGDRSWPKDRKYFEKELKKLREKSQPIIYEVPELQLKNYVYFRQSKLITYLEVSPYLQFALLLAFIMMAYLSIKALKDLQQERIWLGMAKETAHQLGTPTSSLVGWIENIRLFYPEDENLGMMADEMAKDVELLNQVAYRFSKLGASAELKEEDLLPRLEKLLAYSKERASRKVQFMAPNFEELAPIVAPINGLLFDWVIENLFKNALDAMDGHGEIALRVYQVQQQVIIEIQDSGKGMPKKLHKKIFQAGFSTKQRGWGLGLSLSKRIVEQYHNGRIYVKESVPGEGTIFRIQLPTSLG